MKPFTAHLRRILIASVIVLTNACSREHGPVEVAVPWDQFEADGWYAADPENYGDCAVGLEKVNVADRTGLQLQFAMQGLNFATFRNHEIERTDWRKHRALMMDFDNQSSVPLRIAIFLSNDPQSDATQVTWHQSVPLAIPAGVTQNVRVGLTPEPPGKGAPKDWSEEAWQFLKLDRSDVQKIAIRVYGEEETSGSVVVSNPRFMLLEESP